MDNIGEITLNTIEIFGLSINYNPNMLIMTWLVMTILTILAVIIYRRAKLVPGNTQSIFELIYDYLEDITISTLGEKDGQKYLPFILTIFVFILFSNWIGILPSIGVFLGSMIGLIHNIVGGDAVSIAINSFSDINLNVSEGLWYSFLFNIPAIEEPTKFISTDLALGIMVFFVVQSFGIKNKGILGYLRGFVDDPFPMKGWTIILFPINPFFYLNIIGSIANVVSHSFRLWGNIFGGAMIIVIVSSLIKHLLLPVGLLGFFGLFAGIVQAFVFTMLTVTYIQQQQ